VKKTRRKGNKRRKKRGMLTLEWILLVTILVIGLVAGIAAVRGALVSEFAELIQSICGVDVGP